MVILHRPLVGIGYLHNLVRGMALGMAGTTQADTIADLVPQRRELCPRLDVVGVLRPRPRPAIFAAITRTLKDGGTPFVIPRGATSLSILRASMLVDTGSRTEASTANLGYRGPDLVSLATVQAFALNWDFAESVATAVTRAVPRGVARSGGEDRAAVFARPINDASLSLVATAPRAIHGLISSNLRDRKLGIAGLASQYDLSPLAGLQACSGTIDATALAVVSPDLARCSGEVRPALFARALDLVALRCVVTRLRTVCRRIETPGSFAAEYLTAMVTCAGGFTRSFVGHVARARAKVPLRLRHVGLTPRVGHAALIARHGDSTATRLVVARSTTVLIAGLLYLGRFAGEGRATFGARRRDGWAILAGHRSRSNPALRGAAPRGVSAPARLHCVPQLYQIGGAI